MFFIQSFWTANLLTGKSAQKLLVAQRAKERAMLSISLDEWKRNPWIRFTTKVRDVVEAIAKRNWRWAYCTNELRKVDSKAVGVAAEDTY